MLYASERGLAPEFPLPVNVRVAFPDGSSREIAGSLSEILDQVILLTTSEPISVGTAISVQCDDVLFVGEAVSSEKDEQGGVRTHCQVRHTLSGLTNLTASNAKYFRVEGTKTLAMRAPSNRPE